MFQITYHVDLDRPFICQIQIRAYSWSDFVEILNIIHFLHQEPQNRNLFSTDG